MEYMNKLRFTNILRYAKTSVKIHRAIASYFISLTACTPLLPPGPSSFPFFQLHFRLPSLPPSSSSSSHFLDYKSVYCIDPIIAWYIFNYEEVRDKEADWLSLT